MTDDVRTDAQLAQQIRRGDREALGALYDRYAAQALAVAVRIVSDRSAAEDVVHDTFVAIWQRIDRFDPARGSMRAWLLTATRNRALDRVRGARPAIDVAEADDQALLRTGPNPTWDGAVAELDAAAIRRGLEALPPEQREAIELAYFGGRTYREIARLTGVPEGTASGRLRLGLAKLRVTLAGPTDRAPVRMASRAERWERP